MRKVGFLLVLACLSLASTGCSAPDQAPPEPAGAAEAAAAASAAHSSVTSLDWSGTYRGVVPCADCEGIETEITLGRNGTYVLKTRYLGKEATGREAQGAFTWVAGGSAIRLEGLPGRPGRYQVVENALVQLDVEGRPIPDDLAPKYRLAKVTETPDASEPGLVGISWRLTEVEGRPVEAAEEPSRSPFLRFTAEGKVQGFGGCNTFGGTYELPAPTRIRFSKMAATLMACPAMDTETALFRVLEQADNYSLGGAGLSLNKARMAPLARFEAVP